jgi:hypothetical protein
MLYGSCELIGFCRKAIEKEEKDRIKMDATYVATLRIRLKREIEEDFRKQVWSEGLNCV